VVQTNLRDIAQLQKLNRLIQPIDTNLPEANALRNKSLSVHLGKFLLCNALQRFESASVAVVFDPNPSKPFDSQLTALC